MSECPEKLKTRRQQGHKDSKPTVLLLLNLLQGSQFYSKTCYMEMFEPFINEGSVSLSSDLSDAVAVKIL